MNEKSEKNTLIIGSLKVSNLRVIGIQKKEREKMEQTAYLKK